MQEPKGGDKSPVINKEMARIDGEKVEWAVTGRYSLLRPGEPLSVAVVRAQFARRIIQAQFDPEDKRLIE